MTTDIANRLFELRVERGFSKQKLADMLGLSCQEISAWERTPVSPDADNLILLSRLYEVTIEELLGTSEEKNRDEKQEPVTGTAAVKDKGSALQTEPEAEQCQETKDVVSEAGDEKKVKSSRAGAGKRRKKKAGRLEICDSRYLNERHRREYEAVISARSWPGHLR